MTTKSNPEERRKYTRISFELAAELRLNDITFTGKVKNISFSGVYMYCANSADIPIGETGVFRLFLQDDPHPAVITFTCKTVRTDESGAGIRFITIDLEGYQQFKNLMVYNSPDPDKLLAELEKNPGLDMSKGT